MCSEETTLLDEVHKWVNEQGYPLEYRICKIARRNSMTASIGRHIISSQGVHREADIIGHRSVEQPDSHTAIESRFLVECKYSKKRPWIGFSDSLGRNPRLDIIATPHSRSVSRGTDKTWRYHHAVSRTSRYSSNTPICFRVAEGLCTKRNTDRAYEAIQKTCGLAWDFANRRIANRHLFSFVAPILVIDGPLFIAKYDDKSEQIQVSECSHLQVSWSGTKRNTLVDVVKADCADDFFASLSESLNVLHSIACDIALDLLNGPNQD